MRQVLNVRLYRKLERAFGDVSVARQGRRGQLRFGKKQLVVKGQVVTQTKLIKKPGEDAGEEYHVNCPFCGDHRKRLYINHTWGSKNPVRDSAELWIVNCYNSGCLRDYDNRKALFEMVFKGAELEEYRENESAVRTQVQPELPGILWPLDKMQEAKPEHPALRYMASRDYDPNEIAKWYEVGFCLEARDRYAAAQGRIVAVIRHKGKLVSWTARLPREPIQPREPKWVHGPFPVGSTLYNLDQASQFKVVNAVEGPGDVWGLGRNSFGLLGKTVGVDRAKIIRKALKKNPEAVVCVVLDPNQHPKDIARGTPHHLTRAVADLREVLQQKVVPIWLPAKSDPGFLDRTYQLRLQQRVLAKEGLEWYSQYLEQFIL